MPLNAARPHAAAAYLQRALDERAPGDERGHLLAELAVATFDAGLPARVIACVRPSSRSMITPLGSSF
jgi:hypothetical protein